MVNIDFIYFDTECVKCCLYFSTEKYRYFACVLLLHFRYVCSRKFNEIFSFIAYLKDMSKSKLTSKCWFMYFAYGVLSLDLQSFSFEMERMFIIVSCILLFLPFGAFWNVWMYVLVWSREENCCSVKMFIFIPISMCDVCLWMYFTVENKILYWQIQASALCSSWLCSIAVVESPDWNYFSGIHCVH